MASEPEEVLAQLGPARAAWDKLRARLDATAGARAEWKFYGAKYGWQLKVTAGRRALVYLIPHDGYFTAALALRDDAIAALAAARYPSARLQAIREARPSTEGRPARVEVRTVRDLRFVEPLLAAKLA